MNLTLEVIWRILENGRWTSKQRLKEASDVDDDTIDRIITFLDRWHFIDIRRSAGLLVRRKPGTISPVQTFDLLRELTGTMDPKLATRIACRVCDGRKLSLVGVNEVECEECHEKQWYAISKQVSQTVPLHN